MKTVQPMDWPLHQNELDEKGFTIIPSVLSQEECEHLTGLYQDNYLYQNTINMKRYRFGQGQYKYFNYPLPPIVHVLRETFYAPLAALANDWMKKLSVGNHFPETHAELIEQCRAHAQLRPTPLILYYTPGGFNTLHQDLYGEIYFPFQVVFVLTQQGRDHEGGEFVPVEQIPRAQSKANIMWFWKTNEKTKPGFL